MGGGAFVMSKKLFKVKNREEADTRWGAQSQCQNFRRGKMRGGWINDGGRFGGTLQYCLLDNRLLAQLALPNLPHSENVVHYIYSLTYADKARPT